MNQRLSVPGLHDLPARVVVRLSERETLCWAILKRSENRLDGARSWLDGTPNYTTGTRLFATRAEARAFMAERYGYMRDRADLRAEPHGCRMPQVVRVRVTIEIE